MPKNKNKMLPVSRHLEDPTNKASVPYNKLPYARSFSLVQVALCPDALEKLPDILPQELQPLRQPADLFFFLP